MGAESTVINYANNLQYIGKVQNSSPQGTGKLIFSQAQQIQGEFVSGVPKFGRLINQDYTYEGQFQQAQISGKGVISLHDGVTYSGSFSEGKFKEGIICKRNQGKQVVYTFEGVLQSSSHLTGKGSLVIEQFQVEQGKYVPRNIKMEGQFFNGSLRDKGVYNFENGDRYEGEFVKGLMNGSGRYKSAEFQLTGMFENSSPSRQAIVTFSNGDRYEGQLKNGQFHGFGKYVYKNGDVYLGNFYCGTQWGECTVTYKSGEIERYEGEVNEGKWNGIGILYYNNGVIYKGYFQDGSKNGMGVLIYVKSKFKCLFLMDKLIGQIKYFQ